MYIAKQEDYIAGKREREIPQPLLHVTGSYQSCLRSPAPSALLSQARAKVSVCTTLGLAPER